MNSVQCTLYSVQCKEYIIHYIIYSLPPDKVADEVKTLDHPMFTCIYRDDVYKQLLITVHCTMYTVQCTMYSIQCTMYTIYVTVYIT